MTFQKRERINWVMANAEVDYGQALRLIDLYDLIVYIKGAGKEPSLNWLAKNRGTTYPLVRRNVTLMQKLGWLSFITVDAVGTEWVIKDTVPSDATPVVPSYAAAEDPLNVMQVAPINTMRGGRPNAAPVQDYFLDYLNREEEEIIEPEKKNSSSSLKSSTIQLWNELKPSSWKSISSISPSRDRTIKALGGYQAFIDQLPDFFAGVKSNPFWSKKPGISFENVMGSGVVPKSHFTEMVEAGLDSNSNTTPDNLEHPDFFPPVGKFADMTAKHNNFIDEADAQRREDEAREFYAAQEASK